jgi:molybdopterin molybdotransferase
VGPQQAVRIMTGAPLPQGADAVLPVEKSEVAGDEVSVLEQLSPGKHVGRLGEDVSRGSVVLSAGRRLRPQDVGVLSSIGVDQVSVVRAPRVLILVTGDELLPAGSPPQLYCITDANSPMLTALVRRDGGLPGPPQMVPDQKASILEALRKPADVVLISGGSSVGQEDHAPQLLAEHGELAIHGIAMRPSSPAGMGTLMERLVFLLPGNPVSCLCAYDFFAGRAIRALAGRSREWPYVCRRLPLRRKLVSTVGRVDYARVRIVDQQVEPLAISGASVLSSTTRATGFVIVPADSEGFPAGAEVDVLMYDD